MTPAASVEAVRGVSADPCNSGCTITDQQYPGRSRWTCLEVETATVSACETTMAALVLRESWGSDQGPPGLEEQVGCFGLHQRHEGTPSDDTSD